MTIDRFIFRFAGTLILTSLALSHYHHPYWLFVTGFVGLNMFQSSFTGFCLLAKILKKAGLKSGAAF